MTDAYLEHVGTIEWTVFHKNALLLRFQQAPKFWPMPIRVMTWPWDDLERPKDLFVRGRHVTYVIPSHLRRPISFLKVMVTNGDAPRNCFTSSIVQVVFVGG